MDCAETFCKRIYYVVSGKEDLSKNGVIGSLNLRGIRTDGAGCKQYALSRDHFAQGDRAAGRVSTWFQWTVPGPKKTKAGKELSRLVGARRSVYHHERRTGCVPAADYGRRPR